MPTLSTTLGKNMQLKAQFGHKSRPAGGNFGLVLAAGLSGVVILLACSRE